MITARIIKKYPNRRLYDTEESRYITLADIKNLVLNDRDLVVIDKESGDDITGAIFLRVISEQEQHHTAILSEKFLAQVIRCHDKADAALLASQLEQSLQDLMAQQQHLCASEHAGEFSEQSKNTLTSGP